MLLRRLQWLVNISLPVQTFLPVGERLSVRGQKRLLGLVGAAQVPPKQQVVGGAGGRGRGYFILRLTKAKTQEARRECGNKILPDQLQSRWEGPYRVILATPSAAGLKEYPAGSSSQGFNTSLLSFSSARPCWGEGPV